MAQVTVRLTYSQATIVRNMVQQAILDSKECLTDGTVGLTAQDKVDLSREISDYKQILKEFS